MDVLERLIFGTGRLAGGVTENSAVKLVLCAYGLGIRRYDTAPSYGLGTAEDVLGAAFAGDVGIHIATKVGSTRPSHPYFKTLARSLKRASNGNSSRIRVGLAPMQTALRPGMGNFEKGSVLSSLGESLRRLRRNDVDCLFFHEMTGPEYTEEAVAILSLIRDDGLAEEIGLSNSGQYDDLIASKLNSEAGQFSVAKNMFDLKYHCEENIRLHGVIPAFNFLFKHDDRLNSLVERIVSLTKRPVNSSFLAAMPYAMLFLGNSKVNLIYNTTSSRRLIEFIDALKEITDTPPIADEIYNHYQGFR